MASLEAIYDGRAFVPVSPVALVKNQPVFLSYRLPETSRDQSALAVVEFLQKSPFSEIEINCERDKSTQWRGTENALFA